MLFIATLSLIGRNNLYINTYIVYIYIIIIIVYILYYIFTIYIIYINIA